MSIDVVIVTYNNAATIERCLKSLPKDVHVSIEDNNSTDATVDVLKNAGQPYYLETQNQGFATGANRGAARGSSEYIFFLNPDAYLTEPYLAPAIRYLEAHPQVTALGFQLASPSGEIETSFGKIVSPLSVITRHYEKVSPPSTPTPVGWVSGGALLLRRSAFEAVAGFDPQFFLYWEDVDLCRQLREHSYQVVYFPEIRVVHSRGASLHDDRKKIRLYDQSADKYFRKHYSPLIWFTLRFLRSLYRFFSPQVH